MDFSFAYHPRLIEIRRAAAPTAHWQASGKLWTTSKVEFAAFLAAADAAFLAAGEFWSIEVLEPEQSIQIGSQEARQANHAAIRAEVEAREAAALAAQAAPVAFMVGEPRRRSSDEAPNMEGCTMHGTVEEAIAAAQEIMRSPRSRTRPLAIAAVSQRPTLGRYQEDFSVPSGWVLRWIYIRREACTRFGRQIVGDTTLADFMTNGKPGVRERII